VTARTGTPRSLAAISLVLWLLNLLRWHRATRPEPLPDAPAGSTTVRTEDGLALHAQVGGRPDSDLTIVFVHGFLARTLEFDMQWNHYADKARLIRYDHRNHGRSDRAPSRTIDVGSLARDLRSVLEQLAPDGRVVLVGHSMGGMTVLALALQDPELFIRRVAGVGLISTGAGHYIDGHRVENALRWASRRRLLALNLAVFRLLAPLLEPFRPRRTRTMRRVTREVMFGTADVDPATLSMTHPLLEEPVLSTFASLHGALLRHDALDALPALRHKPIAIITGAEDRLTRPEHSRRMAQDIGSNAVLTVIPGAGHVVNQTRPGEVNAALDQLLTAVTQPAALPAMPPHLSTGEPAGDRGDQRVA
jgi:pimeloyl-ACP methyl ester carboxylesterase